jgi:hypothetical protein
MTGLFLLSAAAVWLVLAAAMAYAFTSRLKNMLLRSVAALASFGVLLPLPLVDELIGKQQFESLCKKYAIDEEHAPNARVVSVGGHSDWYAADTAVRIRIQPWIYQDTTTQKVVVSYHTLHAKGGWLIRALGISETRSSLLFSLSCAPSNERAFIKTFNITVTN